MSATFHRLPEIVKNLKTIEYSEGTGFIKRGGRYMPPLVADIGYAMEAHLKIIGLLEKDGPDEHQQKHIAEKRAEFEQAKTAGDHEMGSDGSFPDSATLCGKCYTKALVLMDGCMTCLSCGDSKCG